MRVARSQYVPRIASSRVTSLYLSYPKMSASMSVTIIDVSDSLTSRAFAAERIGAKRFNPEDRRSAAFDGMVIASLLLRGRHQRREFVASPTRAVAPTLRPPSP